MGLSNYIPSSRVSQAGVCTSTTRPASPYEGQMIYETDTDKVLVWNGSAWYANWNTAWGQVAYASRTTNLSNIGTTATEVTSVTFTAVANRRYAITGNCNVYKEGSTNYAQALIHNGSTQIGRIGLAYVTVGHEQTFCGTMFETPGAGSVTYKLMILFSANTLNEVYASSTGPAYIQVSDIGPA